MLSLLYFQEAEDLFDPVANLMDAGVVASFHTALVRTREHLVCAAKEAQPGGSHPDLCYHFQVGTMLLMSFLDGLAVYVEKKIAVPTTQQIVYWASHTTFVDPRFSKLRAIQQRTKEYIIKGGITANTLRNFSKHYLPWIKLSDCSENGGWDIRFPITPTDKSGPLLDGLLYPLFNDAVSAYIELANLKQERADVIHLLK